VRWVDEESKAHAHDNGGHRPGLTGGAGASGVDLEGAAGVSGEGLQVLQETLTPEPQILNLKLQTLNPES
jgi:hypothetical protein